MAELCDYVSRHDIAVVFALDLPVQAPTLKSLRAAGARKVIAYWGAPMSGLNQGWRLVLKRLEVRLLHRHRPDLFIFESKAMQLHAVQGRGISEDSTMVVNTGIEPTVFRPLPESRNLIYSRLNVPSGRKIVVFMGHLHERKGVHILLDAADILVTGRKRQDVHFVFLGDRPGEAENFREHGRLARKQGFVTFGGYHTNIPELLAGCYLGCVPSSGWDSFPMSPVEMQACGIPVIVSDLQGTPETILDGRTGVVVRAGDAGALANAIESLLDDPAQRDRMSQQARAHVLSTLTVEHQVAGLVTALRKVI
jgi:glycosyltransferase involved in cell wall biosynthesis